VIPVGQFMPDALAAVLRQAPLTPEKVAFAWRSAVGPAMDKVTAVELHGSTLRVRAKDPQWRREIERAAAIIRTRMNVVLGPGIVKGLEVYCP
jgi:hypothetical protein